jgi:nucleotide-binding universal stress UspA family protein
MTKVLVPVDGSVNAQHAIDTVLKQLAEGRDLEVHLLNVQPQILSGHAKMYLKKDVIDDYYQEEAAKALKPAQDRLDEAGVKYTASHRVGSVAETIAKYVKANDCGLIIMGTRGLGSVSGMLLGSVATKVLHLVDVPVTLVK